MRDDFALDAQCERNFHVTNGRSLVKTGGNRAVHITQYGRSTGVVVVGYETISDLRVVDGCRYRVTMSGRSTPTTALNRNRIPRGRVRLP